MDELVRRLLACLSVAETMSSLSPLLVARVSGRDDSCLRWRWFLNYASYSDDTDAANGAIDDVVGLRASRRNVEWFTGRWRPD